MTLSKARATGASTCAPYHTNMQAIEGVINVLLALLFTPTLSLAFVAGIVVIAYGVGAGNERRRQRGGEPTPPIPHVPKPGEGAAEWAARRLIERQQHAASQHTAERG